MGGADGGPVETVAIGVAGARESRPGPDDRVGEVLLRDREAEPTARRRRLPEHVRQLGRVERAEIEAGHRQHERVRCVRELVEVHRDERLHRLGARQRGAREDRIADGLTERGSRIGEARERVMAEDLRADAGSEVRRQPARVAGRGDRGHDRTQRVRGHADEEAAFVAVDAGNDGHVVEPAGPDRRGSVGRQVDAVADRQPERRLAEQEGRVGWQRREHLCRRLAAQAPDHVGRNRTPELHRECGALRERQAELHARVPTGPALHDRLGEETA